MAPGILVNAMISETHGKHAIKVQVAPDPDLDSGSLLWPSIGEYPCYDAQVYCGLTNDEARNARFQSALIRTVKNKIVLDIGTGQHLNWALESVRCGAGSVVAVEVMEDAYNAAAARIKSLEMDRDITLLLGNSMTLDANRIADVCVSEIIGEVAGAEGAAAVLLDARERLLRPGGIIIPHWCATLAAAASLRGVLGGAPVAFSQSALPYLSRLFAWNGSPFDVRLCVWNPDQNAIVSDCGTVEVLEFNGDLRAEQATAVSLRIEKDGVVDGVLAWLQMACLADEEPLDVLQTKTSWGSAYFPMFDSEIPVTPGDILDLTFKSTLSNDDSHPDYVLTGTIRHANGRIQHGYCSSPYRNRGFRGNPLYRKLFPEW